MEASSNFTVSIMRILYIAMRHEYGNPTRGLSFEETNFRSALEAIGHDLVAFDFMEHVKSHGVEKMRRMLVTEADAAKPDIAFFFLFTDQLDTTTIEEVGRVGGCPTVNWFGDDHWRFESFSRHMAPAFDLCITTDPDSLARYQRLPGVRAHLSQWACNHYAYGKRTSELKYDVTFVGQPHGERRKIAAKVRDAGFALQCWGFGWPSGSIEHEQMILVFSSSRINLNLSNSAETTGARARLRRLLRLPLPPPRPPQIKGRNFEVPGCGGFLLTERVPHLERYFELGREVAVYDGVDDLLAKIDYWLGQPDERQQVADAGHRRVMAEHTYAHRFAAIFRELELESEVALKPHPG
jgi:spore maturation protein CgeB